MDATGAVHKLKSYIGQSNWRRVHKRMMRPLRNDVIPAACEDHSSCACFWRILTVTGIVVILLSCGILFSQLADIIDLTESNASSELPDPQAFLQRPCPAEIGEKTKEELKSWIQKEVEMTTKKCSKNSRLSPDQMRNIVREELRRQQRSQLKPDFASASAGGMVLSASPTWTEGYSLIYFFFIPIRSTAPSPSIVLEPTHQPGDCWPMKDSRGSLIMQLAARANIIGFTVEHIDAAMSLSGGTPEAPANFTVYGLDDPDSDDKKHFFGSYFYDNKKDEKQYFRAQNTARRTFIYVKVQVNSNHGNQQYTCLYRFQVHGFIDRAYHCQ